MNRLGKTTGKLAAIAQIFALTLLAACSAVGNTGATLSNVNPATACHATGDAANPYQEVNITNDIFPVPAFGCPTTSVPISNGMFKICHATGNEETPYEKITVSVIGLNGHAEHEGDVFPNSEGECTTNAVVDDKITICHATSSATNPYNEITVSVNGLNGHGDHVNDLIPMPESGCPTTR